MQSERKCLPNPECETECRLDFGASTTTLVYNPVIYDKDGIIVSKDTNIQRGVVSCLTCRRSWIYTSQYGEYKYEEIIGGSK